MTFGFQKQAITRERPAFVDDGHGNLEPSWASPETLVIQRCSVTPGASQRDLVNREATLIQFTVHAPAGVDVLATDRIDFGGVKYGIDGEPERWTAGVLDHTKLLLKRWEG